jgi:hypothetical protein
MTDLEKAARLALDALLEMTEPQRTASEAARYKLVQAAIDALDAALAHQKAEPVQAKPVALTDDEIVQMVAQWSYELHGNRATYMVRMTEKAHGIDRRQAEPVDKALTKPAPQVDKEQAEPVAWVADWVWDYVEPQQAEPVADSGNPSF